MKESLALLDEEELSQVKPRRLNRIAKSVLQRMLKRVTDGEIVLFDRVAKRYGKPTDAVPVTVSIAVDHPSFYSDVVFGGSVGAAESYMAGHWHCPDLPGLVRILLRNRAVLDGLDSGLSLVSAPLRKAVHTINSNSRRGARKNIAAHYDLGNEFFRLFLDDTMMYSCALFERPDMTLREASLAKLDAICRKLRLGPNDHVIEIGTGWGGFALHAAMYYGCKVTTTTISKEQLNLARERVQAAGLADKITVLSKDYRDLTGTYDKLVSIEMIEAIGHRYYGSFFAKCADLLKPDGIALIQAITIADHAYKRARDEVDFIKRYIFPGSCIPSVTAMLDAAARNSDLKPIHLQDIGPHYAITLRRWREAFISKLDRVYQMGHSESFARMWEFYLAYCEGGFEERALGDVQLLLAKPDYRGPL